MAKEIKYRPALTEDQLKHLYSVCTQSELRTYLRQYLTKIGAGIVEAGYICSGTRENHLSNSLGFSTGEVQNARTVSGSLNTGETDRTTFDDCGILLELYNTDPLALTAAQLERLHSHRYAENLMTPEEEKEYEQRLGL